MSRLLAASERWFRLLQHLYPRDFRDEMGQAQVETYMDCARGGRHSLWALWIRALTEAPWNGAAERLRPAASWRRPGDWGRDIELAGRRLARSPVFAVTAIGTLTAGLGLFAVAYTVVQRVLLDPMPYKNPGDLYYVWRDYGPISHVKRGALAGTDIAELQKSSPVIESVSALQPYLGGIFALREGGEPMEIAVTRVSPNFFDLLSLTPVLGRRFAPDEVGPGRQVMILTHDFWNRLGADTEIAGKEVRFQGRPFTVVGVLGPDFHFVRNNPAAPPQRVEAFTSFEFHVAETNLRQGGYAGLIRARRGASPEQVAIAVKAAGRAIDERDFAGRGLQLYPVELKADVISRIQPALVVLGAAGLVLLIMLMVNLA
ncbi:MAG: hypothetical protein FJW31_30780 [Acidobacteria bacterium]|nr:hypothetical protein [Acidobacteriota bacterium]